MSHLPRLAVGAIEPTVDSTPLLWGLLAALDRRDLGVQSFLSRACFSRRDGATSITGLAPRHLDSWLMTRDLARKAFLRGMRHADVGIVEGIGEGAFFGAYEDNGLGGRLDTLCDWLCLTRLAVVDVRRLTNCRLPRRPPGLDGLLLDGVDGRAAFCRWQTHLETLWGVPVLGAMPSVETARREIASLGFGEAPSPKLIAALADAFERETNIERLLALAAKNDFPFRELDDSWDHVETGSLRIAMACDGAFRCYFPDLLEVLEQRGATICDFSPLKDERLPADTDIVYIGCGRPDLHWAELSANTCMLASLREHLCGGRRIYAECGGLAYLSRQIQWPDGTRTPMASVLPVTAHLREPEPPRPVEARLSADCWLGRRGSRLRGYLNSRWTFSPTALQKAPAIDQGSPADASAPHAAPQSAAGQDGVWSPPLIAHQQAIGSRLHLDFAAQPEVLESFFRPHAAKINIDSPALTLAL